MTKYSNNLIDNFPDYLFNKINQQKLALRQSGEDVIDLGYGNPDIPSHELVVEKLIESAQIKKNHKYSVSKGIHGLRNAIANKYLRGYKINLDQIFVILDDKDLPLGKIRFRKKGSSGGHNGLKSIIEKFKTHNFNRIRIGIGSPPLIKGTNEFNTISHVLGNISLEEKSILDKVFRRVIESLEQLNTKKEEYIISEINSFDKDQN